jgi:serine/threonine-protein kinase HipA
MSGNLRRLLDDVVFNYLVGNNDAHGKNFSLLYRGGIGLAPLYDVVSTVYYPELSQDMAMRIGAQYSSESVTMKDFEQLAAEAGLGKGLVRGRVAEMVERVVAARAKVDARHRVAAEVAELIKRRADHF